MLLQTGFFLLVLTFVQVPAECVGNVQADFIENVLKESENRIVSGWEAYPGQHPHQVSLRMVSPAGEVSACGGSVVHRSWVITAAHCTAGRITVVVRAGLVNLTRTEYIFETWEWYNHPTYNDQLPGLVQPNDIAVVKLQRPVTYTRVLRSIKLQSSVESFLNYDSEVVYTSGYGRTWSDGPVSEVLNWVYLRAISNPSCAQTFGSIITDNTICAHFYNVTSQSTCHGDSGGPLVHVSSDGVPVLIGVTSFVAGGSFGCHSGLPAGFIRTGPFLGWLQQVTGVDFENLVEEDDTAPEPEVPTTTPEPEVPTTKPPTSPNPDTDEEEEDEDNTDSSESEEDPELSELLKKILVKVKVKVKLNKYVNKKKIIQIIKKS